MKINRKIQNIGLAAFAGLAVIGLIIGSFLDQKITEKIGDFSSPFGIIFTALGPVLVLAFGVLVGALLFFMPKLENKKWDIFFRVLGMVAVVGFLACQLKEGFDYTDFPVMQEHKTVYKVLIGAFTALLDGAIFLFSRIWVKKMDEKALVPICIIVVTIIVIYFIGGEVVKYLASRPRPRVLATGVHSFKQWYEWKPFAAFKDEYDDCKSFVSGHAANATCLVTILPLIAALGKKENDNKIQIITLVIGALFTLIVCLSRIVALAHFLTDVMGGIILSCAIQAVVINVAPIILKKIE